MGSKWSRRGFLKFGLSAAAALGLSPFVKGCATVSETRKDVQKIQWDANPAIPIPTNGCYLGWHSDMIQVYYDMNRAGLLKRWRRVDAPYIKKHLSYHEMKGNCLPAVYSFSDMHIGADWFPRKICETLHGIGVIPLIRFFPGLGYADVAKGEFDDDLIRFGLSVTRLGAPLFFVPWPPLNCARMVKGYLYRSAPVDPEATKAAWVRMHKIFEDAGANEYALWGLNLLPSRTQHSIEDYKLEPQLFDWLGFTIYTLRNWCQSEDWDHNVKEACGWAQRQYPNKPVALFEIGKGDSEGQGRWIRNAYRTIKEVPRIKMVMYAEFPYAGFGSESSLISQEALADYKEAIGDPYFIKGGLMKG
jgi:hypothetical protein